MEPAFPPRKLDLMLHLVANLPQPLLLRGADRSGMTRLLRQFQSHAHGNWLVCYLQATPNLTFDYIAEEALRLLRKPSDGPAGRAVELLEDQLAEMERHGRSLVLLLDNAGTLMPGLLQTLVRYASFQPQLKLVCALTPEDFAAKGLTDPAALNGAQMLPLGLEHDLGPGGVTDIQPEDPVRPGQPRKSWAYALSGLTAAALVAGAIRYGDGEILRDLQARWEEGSRPAPEPVKDAAPLPAPAVPQTPPDSAGGGRESPAEPMAAQVEAPAPAPAEAPPAEPAPPAQAETAPPPDTPPAPVPAEPAPPPVPVPPPPAPAATVAVPPAAAAAPAAPPAKPNTLADLKDAAWLQQQDPKGYTLQLITVSQPARLAGFVRGFPPSDQIALYKTARAGGDLYTVVYGIYPSLAAALAAAAELPSRQGKPVPRPLKAVHQEIRKAQARDEAAASDKPQD